MKSIAIVTDSNCGMSPAQAKDLGIYMLPMPFFIDDKEYLEALIRYNKALAQRNTLLKSEFPVEEELFLVWEEMMAQAGEIVFRKREAFIEEFIPIFQSFYSFISQDKEQVGLCL